MFHRFLLHQQLCREANLEVALILLALGDGSLILEFFYQVIIFSQAFRVFRYFSDFGTSVLHNIQEFQKRDEVLFFL